MVTHVFARHRHGVTETERFSLADEVDVSEFGQRLHGLEFFFLAALGEVVLEFEVAVEVILK